MDDVVHDRCVSMGDPGSSSLDAIPRGPTPQLGRRFCGLLTSAELRAPGKLLLSSSAPGPRERYMPAIIGRAGTLACNLICCEAHSHILSCDLRVPAPLLPHATSDGRACTTVALDVRYGLDSRKVPCHIHICKSKPVSQGSMPSSDERSSDGLPGWLVELLPVLQRPGQCPVTCGGKCLGSSCSTTPLSSTVRLTSSREHGPQGRLARVGKRGVLL